MFSRQIELEYPGTVIARAHALDTGDLRTALELDNLLEGLGMHPEDRATCYRCRDWADHAHSPAAGRGIA